MEGDRPIRRAWCLELGSVSGREHLHRTRRLTRTRRLVPSGPAKGAFLLAFLLVASITVIPASTIVYFVGDDWVVLASDGHAFSRVVGGQWRVDGRESSSKLLRLPDSDSGAVIFTGTAVFDTRGKKGKTGRTYYFTQVVQESLRYPTMEIPICGIPSAPVEKDLVKRLEKAAENVKRCWAGSETGGRVLLDLLYFDEGGLADDRALKLHHCSVTKKEATCTPVPDFMPVSEGRKRPLYVTGYHPIIARIVQGGDLWVFNNSLSPRHSDVAGTLEQSIRDRKFCLEDPNECALSIKSGRIETIVLEKLRVSIDRERFVKVSGTTIENLEQIESWPGLDPDQASRMAVVRSRLEAQKRSVESGHTPDVWDVVKLEEKAAWTGLFLRPSAAQLALMDGLLDASGQLDSWASLAGAIPGIKMLRSEVEQGQPLTLQGAKWLANWDREVELLGRIRNAIDGRQGILDQEKRHLEAVRRFHRKAGADFERLQEASAADLQFDRDLGRAEACKMVRLLTDTQLRMMTLKSSCPLDHWTGFDISGLHFPAGRFIDLWILERGKPTSRLKWNRAAVKCEGFGQRSR